MQEVHWNLFVHETFMSEQRRPFQGDQTMATGQTQTTTIPTKRDELSVLPEYTGADGVRVYSENKSPVYWKDDGSHWLLIQRPDGELCKLMLHD